MESLTQYYLPSNVKILTSQEMQQRPGNGVFHCANTITLPTHVIIFRKLIQYMNRISHMKTLYENIRQLIAHW